MAARETKGRGALECIPNQPLSQSVMSVVWAADFGGGCIISLLLPPRRPCSTAAY